MFLLVPNVVLNSVMYEVVVLNTELVWWIVVLFVGIAVSYNVAVDTLVAVANVDVFSVDVE